jgi:hypothetical protein
MWEYFQDYWELFGIFPKGRSLPWCFGRINE